MRNQIDAAEQLGLRIVSYNSAMSKGERDNVERQIHAKRVDAIIIAPEQLGSTYFGESILPQISSTVGLFVVDEAHCISQWGHDFRPDYGRIVRALQFMPSNMPVLATTATANDRVVADIKNQLGERLRIIRGSLMRESLQLQNVYLKGKGERMAWLVENLPTLPGSGIIYAKTTKESETVAEFLQQQGLSVHAYH